MHSWKENLTQSINNESEGVIKKPDQIGIDLMEKGSGVSQYKYLPRNIDLMLGLSCKVIISIIFPKSLRLFECSLHKSTK